MRIVSSIAAASSRITNRYISVVGGAHKHLWSALSFIHTSCSCSWARKCLPLNSSRRVTCKCSLPFTAHSSTRSMASESLLHFSKWRHFLKINDMQGAALGGKILRRQRHLSVDLRHDFRSSKEPSIGVQLDKFRKNVISLPDGQKRRSERNITQRHRCVNELPTSKIQAKTITMDHTRVGYPPFRFLISRMQQQTASGCGR